MGLRYAFRTLRRSPGFALVAIVTLSLGIGINTTVFSIYGAAALKPIAARAPGELVRISGTRGDDFSWQEYEQIAALTGTFSGVIATSDPQVLTGAAQALQARLVSNNYFGVLGVTPNPGRGFAPGERQAVVLSHDYWQRHLGGDPSVVGKTIRVQNVDLAIAGVAPDRFAGTGVPPRMPDVWIPLAEQAELMPGVDWRQNAGARSIQVLARLTHGDALTQASAALGILARTWPPIEGHPQQLRARPATFFQIDSGEFETFGQVCAVLMVAVALILTIGGINLVNLLFARHAVRQREFAVRLALGAGRRQLVRQLCTESVLLAFAGGALGLLFSVWACEWIRDAGLSALERISGGVLGIHLDLMPDWHVFAFTAALACLTGIAIGLWPALHASRRDVHDALKQGGAGTEGGYRGLWSRRNLLVAAQVAACLILLAGAAMLFEGAWRSGSVNPGFETGHLLVLGMDTRTVAASRPAQAVIEERVLERVAALPEVVSVARAFHPPFLGHGSAEFDIGNDKWIRCGDNMVSDGYFAALGVPLLAGRDFTRQEAETHAPLAIVSERAAREAWPGQNPLGRQVTIPNFMFGPAFTHTKLTVVGVVGNIHSTFLSKPDNAFLYVPGATGLGLVRTRTGADSASHAILGVVSAIDPRLPAGAFVIPMDRGPMELQRMMAEAPAIAATILGTLALVLAAVGVFGLVWQLVARRTREIAIRMALGAGRREVTRLVLWQTLRPVMLGAVVGLVGAGGISALLAAMVVQPDMPDLSYGAGGFHPLAIGGVLLVLAVVVLAACLGPVRQAARIAPADALRME